MYKYYTQYAEENSWTARNFDPNISGSNEILEPKTIKQKGTLRKVTCIL